MRVTELRLYTGVKIDENNVVKLDPASLLTSLNTYLSKTYTNLSLVLENFTLRIPENYFSIMQVNYMAFRENTNTRWFFARVEKLEYISDAVTEVKFIIDYWQTYYSDISLLDCFVEREITASDVIGENTLDEGLPVERVEQIERHTESIQSDLDTMFWIGMFTDYDAESDSVTTSNISVYNSGFSGHNLILFQILLDDTISEGKTTSPLEDSIENVANYILKANVSNNGSLDDIKDLFILPYSIVNQSRLLPHYYSVGSYTDGTYYSMVGTIGDDYTDISFAKKLTFSDYTPKNNKCFCYPYNYLLLSNNNGNQNILKYEDFAGANVTVQIQKAISIGCSIRIVPTNYKGQSIDYDEQIPCGKFPTCGWSSDSYINWLTQNSLNLTSQIIGIAGQAVGSVLNTGAGLLAEAEGFEGANLGTGGIANTIQNVLAFMGQFRKAELMPNIEGGSQNNGDVGFASNSNNFVFKSMRATLENLKCIDNFFTKYGYKIARVKTPNLTTSRFNHFYVKTGQGEKAVAGNIPKDGLDIINKQFSNGITVWKTLTGIGNYS